MAASTAPARAFRAEPYDYTEARRLAAELELAEPIAVMLVRRGYRTVEEARDFLEARDDHDPFAFDQMEEVCDRVLAVARRRGRVTVHGDYDVDGVCSTAILVTVLRELGAECDWLIPDRLGDGYGLTLAGVEEIRSRGSEMAITVDCGIGSADEVAAARAAGIEMIVTDHHEPPENLPDCPILHPVVSGYPFSALCAAGVAHKLAIGLRDASGTRFTHTAGGRRDAAAADLDLVALATVADLVPLIGENRRLVRQGLAAMRTSRRPGIRALMAAAKVEPETVDEQAVGFRLAPRINAAGRLYRADAGVELMLTPDAERATQIAAELDRANAERRATEREVSAAAEAARAALPPEQAGAPALVLAGEGWHPGVVGIAASRLAERHWRPTVLLSIDGDRARGSARSIPGFDLIAALDACSEHLVRHGGHRAAAGLELQRSEIEAFREAFLAHATEVLADADPVRTESVDALVGVGREGIGMDLATQLERLGPFGKGNPGPRLVVPSARLRDLRPLGEAGNHSRFELESGAGSASGVAFGMNGELEALAEREALDLGVRLELNRWNGAVAPQVIIRELYPLPADPAAGGEDISPAGCPGGSCPAPAEEWWARLERALESFDGRWPIAPPPEPGGRPREVVDRRRGAAVAALAELVSSGDSVLALCADAGRRRDLAGSAADPRRFGAGEPRIACTRCGDATLDAALGADGEADPADGGLALADWGALARRPSASRRFQHVVLVDPPPFERLSDLARAGGFGPAGSTPIHPGFVHLAWGEPELELAGLCAAREWELRESIAEIWRGMSAAPGGVLEAEDLRAALSGQGRYPRSAEIAARCVRVLTELGLGEWTVDGATRCLRVLSSERTELERSRAFGAGVARHEEAKLFLRSRAQS
jgi:single-stranded-DNA-specific exonuclease